MPGPSHDWHVQPVVKDQIRIPPERRVSVELPALESTGCPRNLCHLHGLFRRVETNLSKVPQPFSIRQPAAYIFRADVDFSGASPLHFADDILQTRMPTGKSCCLKNFFGGRCDLQNPSEPGSPPQRICSEFTLALAPEFAFLSAYYQMFQGALKIQRFLSLCSTRLTANRYRRVQLYQPAPVCASAGVLFFGA